MPTVLLALRTRVVVLLVLVALAVPAVVPSTVPNADAGGQGDNILDLNSGGQFVFWNFGDGVAAADVFSTVKIAWLFDATAVNWNSFVPALGVVNFPLVDGAVLWIVSDGPQSIVVPGVEPPEPPEPPEPVDPELTGDPALTGDPELIDPLLTRDDLGEVVEGLPQTANSGGFSASEWNPDFESGADVVARGFNAAAFRAFQRPASGSETLQSAGAAIEYNAALTQVARWVDGDSAALDLDIGAAQDAEGGATLERLDDFGDGGVFGVSSSELFDVTVVGLIFSHGSYLATSIIHIAGSDAPASAISTARGFVEDWAAELDSRIAALPNPGGPPLTLSLPDYGPFTEGWLIDPLAGPIDRALVTETGGDGEFVNGFTRSYNNPDFLAVAGTFSGVTFVNSAFREWSDEARAIAEYDDALAGTKDLKLEVVPFDDLFPDGAFATEFTLDDIEVFSQIMIRVGRFTATITLSGIGVTGDLAEKVGGLLLEWAQAFADNLAAAQ